MDFLYKIYFGLSNFSWLGIFGKAINKILRLLIGIYIHSSMPIILSKESYNLNKEPRSKRIIFTLTSYPDRIESIWITIKTLFRQSYKADKIILYLSKIQFENKNLPQSLIELINMGLEVRWCDEDFKSHKKYFYAFQEFTNDYIITFDDDFFYPNNVVENLINLNNNFSRAICATRVHKITFGKKGNIKPYRKWKSNYVGKNYNNLFFTSGAGTLFSPNYFDQEIFNSDVFTKICLYADDVWLNIMALKSGIKVVSNKVFNKDAIVVKNSQYTSLVSSNVFESGNDKQIKEVIDYYKIIFQCQQN